MSYKLVINKTYLYFMFQSIVAVSSHSKHTSLSFDHESYINLWKNNHFIILNCKSKMHKQSLEKC